MQNNLMTHSNQNILIISPKFFSKNIIAYLLHLGAVISCILPFPLTTLFCMHACTGTKDASCKAGCGFEIVFFLISGLFIAAILFIVANIFCLLSKNMKCYILLSISILVAIFMLGFFFGSWERFFYEHKISSLYANICVLSICALTAILFCVLDTFQYIKHKRNKNANTD